MSSAAAAYRVCKIQKQLGPCRTCCGRVPWSRVNVNPRMVDTAEPLHVLVTGAAGQISYSLIFLIARGQMFGPFQPVVLHLLDLPQAERMLNGVSMEITDGAFPLVKDVIITADPVKAFTKVNVAVFVGSVPRKAGMERKDLIGKNAAIFRQQGKYLSQYADKDVKVLVVGNPANTNALVLVKNSMGVPTKNITCMTRLDQNRSKAQVAARLGVSVKQVHNVIIWGNHSTTQFPDVSHGYVANYPKPELISPLRSVINNDEWLENGFVPLIQQRGAKVIEARRLSSAASAAAAICDHLRDWLLGTPKGEIVSMGVYTGDSSNGSYKYNKDVELPSELVFSLPVVCRNGEYHIVPLESSPHARKMLELSAKELCIERDMAYALLHQK